MKHTFLRLAVSLLLILILFSAVSCIDSDSDNTTLIRETPLPVLERSEVSNQYTWDLTEFYQSREAFDSDIALLRDEYIPALSEFAGTLNSVESFESFCQMDEAASILLDNAYVYAYLSKYLDQTDSEATEMADIASTVASEYSEAVAFLDPELLSLDEDTLLSFVTDPKMASHQFAVEQLLAQKDHILSSSEEEMLAALSSLTEYPREIFERITLAERVPPVIMDEKGNEIELTSSVYSRIMKSSDRDLRRRAFEARNQYWIDRNHSLSATYIAQIKQDVFFAKTRNYSSAIGSALESNFIPVSIYDQLVQSVNDNLAPLHHYYEIRKEALGLDEMYSYDSSVPLTADYELELAYDEAVELIAEALSPLGEQYVNDFRSGIQNRWVDVYGDDHKDTGAFNWGTYTSPPYILLNYENSLWDVTTLAHEMGHAMNSFYSNTNQDYRNAEYTIFTAEVASTVNQFLLNDYLIRNAASEEEKLYLIGSQIHEIAAIVYKQVMYAEFEQRAHEIAEAGQPLSADILNALWVKLQQKYYGSAHELTDANKVSWDRISHFYTPFYVYKYATSMAAAFEIVNNIKSEKEGALEDYLAFLSAGGSDYPVDMVKKAGADLNSSAPVDNLLAYFDDLVSELERLLGENTPGN